MSRVLIVTDIHGNQDALDAVIADAGAADRIWCLGDIVGYGPEPGACLAWVRDHCEIVLSGNHDYAVFDPAVVERFQSRMRQLRRTWTRAQLSADEVQYLRSLPSLVRGGRRDARPRQPGRPDLDVHPLGGRCTRGICVVHGGRAVSSVTRMSRRATCRTAIDRGDCPVTNDVPFALGGARSIINPGSVGQPRDRDPRAAYLWYDPDAGTVTWKRVPYAIEATQEKIHAAGLPERLASPSRARAVRLPLGERGTYTLPRLGV